MSYLLLPSSNKYYYLLSEIFRLFAHGFIPDQSYLLNVVFKTKTAGNLCKRFYILNIVAKPMTFSACHLWKVFACVPIYILFINVSITKLTLMRYYLDNDDMLVMFSF